MKTLLLSALALAGATAHAGNPTCEVTVIRLTTHDKPKLPISSPGGKANLLMTAKEVAALRAMLNTENARSTTISFLGESSKVSDTVKHYYPTENGNPAFIETGLTGTAKLEHPTGYPEKQTKVAVKLQISDRAGKTNDRGAFPVNESIIECSDIVPPGQSIVWKSHSHKTVPNGSFWSFLPWNPSEVKEVETVILIATPGETE